jgi:PKD repeat protein
MLSHSVSGRFFGVQFQAVQVVRAQRRGRVVWALLAALAFAFSPFALAAEPQFTSTQLMLGPVEQAQAQQDAPLPTVATRSAGLTIVPIFDSSITNDPQSANIQATINAAIAEYQANFADQVTVSIKFQQVSTGLGGSSTYNGTFSYSTFLTKLIAHASTPDDFSSTFVLGLASVGNSNNPVNGNAYITVATANARALGFSANPPTGSPDSTISLNIAATNITAADTDPSKYPLHAVVCHEMDEALGLRSALNNLHNGDAAPTGGVAPEDLFRYASIGTRSFDTNVNTAAYFSPDGGSLLAARFNQNQGGDFSDWYSPGGQVPQIQDAFGTAGSSPKLGVELRALDVIGYTRNLPNLAPYQPGGWSAPIVVSTVTGTTTDSASLTSTDTLYVDFCYANLSSTVQTVNPFTVKLLVDGNVATTVTQPAYLGYFYKYAVNYNLGKLSAGTHTLELVVNPDGSVPESDPTDNTYTKTITVKAGVANTPPAIVSAPSFTPQAPAANAPVTFSVAAADSDNDPLTYAWNFGDGSTGTGVSPMHTYAAAGTYSVTVTVSDGHGGTASGNVSVTVLTALQTSSATKQSFALNFKTGADALDIAIANADFKSLANGQTVSIQIGTQQVDTAVLSRGKGAGQFGKFTVNATNGTLEYSETGKGVALGTLLAPYGAVNKTVSGITVNVPIYMDANGKRYGNTYAFTYSANKGKSGKGM